MARQEQDREDLLREATALVERAELIVDDFADPVVVGFRANRAASFFFGVDPVYQFNTQCEFRRGFSGGRLLKAEQGAIIALTRHRADGQVQLVRSAWDASQTGDYIAAMQRNLDKLRQQLAAGQYQNQGQVPEHVDVVCAVRKWLDAMPGRVPIAQVPNVR